MKKILGGVFLTLLLMLSINVKAESYYTNSKGISMSEDEYNKLKTMVTEKYLDSLDQETFNDLINATLISSETIYQKVVTSNGQEILTKDITEEEYENAEAEDVYTPNSQTEDSISTNYKTLHASLFQLNGHYHLLASLDWKKKPAVTSYDVFAFWSNNFSYSNVHGSQTYYTNGGSHAINYSSSSKGYKGLSNGAGISMNLTDGSNITGYACAISADLSVKNSSKPTYAYISYQHAKYNLSRSQSKSYTLGLSGLGNVVIYADESIRGSYDAMRGVRVNL